jgi:ethanolamine utilization cobalamin adenosyltransferase
MIGKPRLKNISKIGRTSEMPEKMRLTSGMAVAIKSGLRLERAQMEEIYARCVERGDTDLAEKFKKHIQDAIDSMNWIDSQLG